jgi:hypothetical protein
MNQTEEIRIRSRIEKIVRNYIYVDPNLITDLFNLFKFEMWDRDRDIIKLKEELEVYTKVNER